MRLVMMLLLLPMASCNQALGIPDPADSCAADAPFVGFAMVGGVNTELVEQSAWLSSDELTIIFSRETVDPDDGSPRFGDLYTAHRAHRSDDFGQVLALEGVNTELDEFRASLAQDGSTLFLDRQEPETGYAIFTATRLGPRAFSEPTLWVRANGPMQDMEPFVTADALFFSSTRGDNIASLYQARFADGALSPPTPLLSIGSNHINDQNPVSSFDGLTLYFSSWADPAPADPTADVWTARRRDLDEPFAMPHRVDLGGRDGIETPQWISEDSCRLYLMATWSGNKDIWVASRRAP